MNFVHACVSNNFQLFQEIELVNGQLLTPRLETPFFRPMPVHLYNWNMFLLNIMILKKQTNKQTNKQKTKHVYETHRARNTVHSTTN